MGGELFVGLMLVLHFTHAQNGQGESSVRLFFKLFFNTCQVFCRLRSAALLQTVLCFPQVFRDSGVRVLVKNVTPIRVSNK